MPPDDSFLRVPITSGREWSASTAGPGFVISHSVGAIYWLAGLLLSRCAAVETRNAVGKILAGILGMHAVYHFAPAMLLQAGLHLAPQAKTYMPLGDLIYLPLGVMLVALAGGRQLPGARWWQLAALGTAAAGLVMVLAAGKTLLETRWVVCTVYLAAGVFCFFRPMQSGLAFAARLGGFSYALYALHFPILLLLGRLFPARTTAVYGLAAVVLGWLVVFPLAWWVELRLQPRLRKWLDARVGFTPMPRLNAP